MSKVFVTGISGQDGSYLSEYLLELGHEVHGMIRRHSVSENQQYRLDNIRDKVRTHYGDMIDQTSIEKMLSEIRPDYIFNLAAQSHVRISFDIPQYTFQVNALGTLNLLEAYKRICPEARFYQASSSEMFGLSLDADKYQRESTPMNPVSPYGCAKVAAYNLVRHYRRAYGLHACSGILFNHESPRRGANFVTQKVVIGAVKIKLGLQDKIELGNLTSYRDWGHSYDYVRAMWKIANHIKADDFVVATGEAWSVMDMVAIVFDYLDLDYRKHIVTNDIYKRSEELPYLHGDSTRARVILNWAPTYTFTGMMKEMVDHWMRELK
jgi:GDPmannose 4,6-dehydratase